MSSWFILGFVERLALMSQKKVLVVLMDVPEEVKVYILPENAPELPKLREIAKAGIHGNGYYENETEAKLACDLVELFYGEDGVGVMEKYRSNVVNTSPFTSQTTGDFSSVITLAFFC